MQTRNELKSVEPMECFEQKVGSSAVILLLR